jgi:ABC-2 type transport system ATP-binding protein
VPAEPALLEISNIQFAYTSGVPVLRGVSLSVSPGEIVGLIGPNGSGKSTLIKLVFDILASQAGSIRIAGEPHVSKAAKLDAIYLASNDYLPEFLTGTEYLELLARLYDEKLTRAAIREEFRRLGMSNREADLVEDYSHGMRKKVQLVAALLFQRPLSVVDETLNGIDLDALYTCEEGFRSLRRGGRSVLVCTHDFALLERIADRVMMLNGGRIEFDVPTAVLLDRWPSIDMAVRSVLREPDPAGPT